MTPSYQRATSKPAKVAFKKAIYKTKTEAWAVGSGGARLVKPCSKILAKQLVLRLKVRGHRATPQPSIISTFRLGDLTLGCSCPHGTLGTGKGSL